MIVFSRKHLKRPAGNVLRVDPIFEEFHCFNKRRLCSGHDDIYGIEILSAIETSGEVGFWVNGGMESLAQGTAKSKQMVSVSGLDVQKGCYDGIDGDLVSEHSEKIGGEVFFFHGIASYGS